MRAPCGIHMKSQFSSSGARGQIIGSFVLALPPHAFQSPQHTRRPRQRGRVVLSAREDGGWVGDGGWPGPTGNGGGKQRGKGNGN